MKERYSDNLENTIEKIKSEKNKQLVQDYIEGLLKSLTELEKSSLDILYKSSYSLSKNKIRSIFIHSFLQKMAHFWNITLNSQPMFRKINTEQLVLTYLTRQYLEERTAPAHRQEGLIINYPKTINFNFSNADKILHEVFRIEPSNERFKGSQEEKLKLIDKIHEGLSKETETQFLSRIRKILTKNGHRIPSIDVIEKALKFFKEKGWVNCRFQNNNEVWFLTPEMNVLMKKIKIK